MESKTKDESKESNFISFSVSVTSHFYTVFIFYIFLCTSFKRTMWLFEIKVQRRKRRRKESSTRIERKVPAILLSLLLERSPAARERTGQTFRRALCFCCYTFLYTYSRSKSWGTNGKKGKIYRKKYLQNETKRNSQTLRQQKNPAQFPLKRCYLSEKSEHSG